MGHGYCCSKGGETTSREWKEETDGRAEVGVSPYLPSTTERTNSGRKNPHMFRNVKGDGLSDWQLEMMTRSVKTVFTRSTVERSSELTKGGDTVIYPLTVDEAKFATNHESLIVDESKLGEDERGPSMIAGSGIVDGSNLIVEISKSDDQSGEDSESDKIHDHQDLHVGFRQVRHSQEIVEIDKHRIYRKNDEIIEAQLREIDRQKLAEGSTKKTNSANSACYKDDDLGISIPPPTYEVNYDKAQTLYEGCAWKLNHSIDRNSTHLADIESWRLRNFGIKRDSFGRVDLVYISEAENAIWVPIAFLTAEKGAPIAAVEELPAVYMQPCTNPQEVAQRVFDYDFAVFRGVRFKNVDEYKSKLPSMMYPISVTSRIYDDEGAIKSRLVTLGWSSDSERKTWLLCLKTCMEKASQPTNTIEPKAKSRIPPSPTPTRSVASTLRNGGANKASNSSSRDKKK